MQARSRTVLVVLLVAAALPGATGFAAAGVADADPAADLGDAESAADAQAQAACEFPVTETDATGAEVTVDSEPQRIVTLAPSAAQTVWEIGGQDRVVGVSQYAAYLEGAESRTNISAAGQAWVNVEAVVGLEPDLVLAPDVIPNETVQRLRDSGLTVYKFNESGTLEDIQDKTVLTGRLVGECAGAEETVDRMEAQLETVRQAVEGEERPRVLYALGGGWTAGEGTFIGHIIETAGGENVAASANVSGYAQISPEVVTQQDPQWIVANTRDGVPNTAAYNGTTAVQRDQIVTVNTNYINQPAPRTVRVVTKLAKTFHPEAYEATNASATNASAANVSATMNATATASLDADVATTTESEETATTTVAVTDTATASGAAAGDQSGATTEPESTGASTPGFGVVAALAAVLATALLARRR